MSELKEEPVAPVAPIAPVAPKTKFLYFKPPGQRPQLLDFDVNQVHLDAPVTKQGNRKVCVPYYLCNGARIPLKLQTPRMNTPFDLDYPSFGNDTNDAKKYYKQFSLSYRGEEEQADLVEFREVVSSIDQRIIDLLTRNSAAWFPTRGRTGRSREVIDDGYTYLIKDGWSERKQTKYPDNIVVKCNIRQGTLQAAFFNDENEIILDESTINMAGNEAICVLHLADLWIISGYHPKFHACQVQIFETGTVDREYGLVDTGDSPPPRKKQKVQEEDGGFALMTRQATTTFRDDEVAP